MVNTDSSSDFFLRLNAGTESAADELVRRFRQRLCALVEREMGKRFAAREDAEDSVQSAMRSFFRGIDNDRFRIESSGELWRLLEDIVRKKMLKHIEYHDAEKRRPEKEAPGVIEWFPSREPTAEDAVVAAELIERALDGLEPPYPEIFRMRLEGCTRAEIAERLNSTDGAVKFKLDRIRNRLQKLLNESTG